VKRSPNKQTALRDVLFDFIYLLILWLMVEAGDAWMRQVRHDNLISRSHQVLASVFGELGVGHKVEHVTAGGYFSMDVYLPKRIVAVEF
jgi:hypothetical protein